jgi:hypothetical protein
MGIILDQHYVDVDVGGGVRFYYFESRDLEGNLMLYNTVQLHAGAFC